MNGMKGWTMAVACSLLCVGMCAVRLVTSSYYTFLLWNLFLAWLPLLCSTGVQFLHQYRNIGVARLAAWPLTAAWLVLFPNAPYIVTDILHLVIRRNIYYVRGWFVDIYWYDFVMVFLFAWTGLLLGFLSLRQMLGLLPYGWPRAVKRLVTGVFFILCGFGIYLGREVRLNSWDLLYRPELLLHEVAGALHPDTVGRTIVFTLMVAVPYLTMQGLSGDNRQSPPQTRTDEANRLS